ncbi:Plasmodium exported protein (hyp13), unknown function [Plasmodium reichenowi]|uniref:Exported protein (Hyp13) n=1 Tax=Plasmodium reichenowi TaxID=5854 RepID=A0A060RSJ8_PLARE|nr:exported protein (hyp13) [Plasmodium reichenowi]KYO02512.1 exported protein (hyp13) [Plasmodium reichenowi]CDO62439.1 Plasmodium exported protein (hyp13), unknown function [Plasmodium reichenowi]
MSFSQMKILLKTIKYIFLLILHQDTLHKLNIKNNPHIIGTSIRNNRSLANYEKLISRDNKINETKFRNLNKKINKNKSDMLLYNEKLDEELKLYDIEINKYKRSNKDYTYENHYTNNEIKSYYKKNHVHNKYIFNKNINPFLEKKKIFCKLCMKKIRRSINMFKTNFASKFSEANSPMSLIDTISIVSFTSLITFLCAFIASGIALGISYLLKYIFLYIIIINPEIIPIFLILLFAIFIVSYLVKSKKKEKQLMDR